MPQLLICGEQTKKAEKPPQVAGFISEWRPASNRNGGRDQIGIPGRIESEFAEAPPSRCPLLCKSAWGPKAHRRRKPLLNIKKEGTRRGPGSHPPPKRC